MSDTTQLNEFCDAWRRGRVCLHPTDTLPGLSFNPQLTSAWNDFLAIKQRAATKSSIALVADIGAAEKIWQTLPGSWPAVLRGLWPGPLSVVWRAKFPAPPILTSAEGEIALRFPLLSDLWMNEALLQLGGAFPTSSVNHAGEAPCQTWSEAVAWVKEHHPEVYVTSLPCKKAASSGVSQPSTLIRIVDGEHWEILREGAMPLAFISEEVARHDRNI